MEYDAAAPENDMRRIPAAALTAEADKAWQDNDSARAARVKAERERRKIEDAKQRATGELQRGVAGLYGFAFLMAALIVFDAAHSGRAIGLVALLVPAALGGLAYYAARGNRLAALAGAALVLALTAVEIFLFKQFGAVLTGAATATACLGCLAVKGSFALHKLGG